MVVHLPLSGRLPDWQPVIKTRNKVDFETFVASVAKSRDDYPIIGVVDGLPGIGKSVATYNHVIGLKERPHNGLRSAMLIELKPGVTRREVARSIVVAAGEKPRGHNINRFSLADDAIAAILDNDIEYIIYDEGDRLDEDSFEMIRDIFDATGCPMIIVGLPSIRHVIARHEKIESRVGFYLRFTPLNHDETLRKILPELVFPAWTYDPTNPADLAMGEYLLGKVGGSFRRLRNVLNLASEIVYNPANQTKITRDDIDEAVIYAQRHVDNADLQSAKPGLSRSGDRGEAEIKSEQRNAYKRGNRQGS